MSETRVQRNGSTPFNDKYFFYKVAKHEMFHLGGADHGGKNDHPNLSPTTMSTCVNYSQFRHDNKITKDDDAYMNYLRGPLLGRELTANPGFENANGDLYWLTQNGTKSVVSSGGQVGPTHLAFTATGTAWTSYVHQSTRVWHNSNPPQSTYGAAADVKKVVSTYTTYARVALYRKAMNDSGNNGCGYPFLNMTDPNNEAITGGYFLISETPMYVLSGTGWTSIEASAATIGHDGGQVQVRVYGASTTSTGGSGTVRFDNVRAKT